MSHLYKIGLENFRVFKEYTEIEFAPITILTGANNSGKSSVIKSLFLLQDNLLHKDIGFNYELAFTDSHLKLGRFDSVINSKNKPLTIVIPTIMRGLSELLSLKLEYKNDTTNEIGNARLKKMSLYSPLKKLPIFEYLIDNENPNISTDFDFFIEKYFDLAESYSQILSNVSMKHLKGEKIDFFDKYYYSEEHSEIKINKHKGNLKFYQYPSLQSYKYSVFYNIDQLFLQKSDLSTPKVISLKFLIWNLFDKKILSQNDIVHIFNSFKGNVISEKDLLSMLENELNVESSILQEQILASQIRFINLQKKITEKYFNGKDDFLSRGNDILVNIAHYYQHLYYHYSEQLYYKFILSDNEVTKNEFEKSESAFSEAFTYLMHSEEKADNFLFNTFIGGNLSDILEIASKYYKSITSLDAVRATTQRLYAYESTTSGFNEELLKFVQRNASIDKKATDFIQGWLKKFEIEGDLKITPSDLGIGFLITIGGRPLADLGYGITQLLPILIKIINIYIEYIFKEKQHPEYDAEVHTELYMVWGGHFSSSTLILEEPEANLHPKFQSLLADMFIDANQKFNIQFVIETHSEYLIRKLQYLTAKKEILPADTSIYYFHNPKKIPSGEKQVKKIEIQDDGSLSSDFGSGFFDEALNWKFELLKLKNKN